MTLYLKKKENTHFYNLVYLEKNDMIKIHLILILTRISLVVIKVWLKFLFNILGNSILGIICQSFFLKSVKILVLGHYLAI